MKLVKKQHYSLQGIPGDVFLWVALCSQGCNPRQQTTAPRAYAKQRYPDYIGRRKHYKWVQYLFVKSV